MGVDAGAAVRATTVQLHVNRLKAIYAAAELDRLVASSPVVRISLPRAERQRIVPLTVAQVRTSPRGAGRNRAMVLTQAGLGLRISELLALRAVDVDFLRRTVRIEHQLAESTGERVEPKTPRSRRTVPLPQSCRGAGRAHALVAAGRGRSRLRHNGRVYAAPMYGTRVFKAAVLRLAEQDPTFPADTSTHDLRHHYASVLWRAARA